MHSACDCSAVQAMAEATETGEVVVVSAAVEAADWVADWVKEAAAAAEGAGLVGWVAEAAEAVEGVAVLGAGWVTCLEEEEADSAGWGLAEADSGSAAAAAVEGGVPHQHRGVQHPGLADVALDVAAPRLAREVGRDVDSGEHLGEEGVVFVTAQAQQVLHVLRAVRHHKRVHLLLPCRCVAGAGTPDLELQNFIFIFIRRLCYAHLFRCQTLARQTLAQGQCPSRGRTAWLRTE